MKILKYALLASAASCIPAVSMLANAQDLSVAEEANGAIYQPEDFAQYGPRTALDMVKQIPGFSIKGDDDGQRGFGQASGNVLINGQRFPENPTALNRRLSVFQSPMSSE